MQLYKSIGEMEKRISYFKFFFVEEAWNYIVCNKYFPLHLTNQILIDEEIYFYRDLNEKMDAGNCTKYDIVLRDYML